MEVFPSVVVEVLKADGPGPVGGVESGPAGGFGEGAESGVEQQGVAHVLGRDAGGGAGGEDVVAGGGKTAAVALAGGGGHVGEQKVEVAVVVNVSEVGAHGGVWRVRDDGVGDVGKGAVAVVAVEVVGAGEVVGDEEIGPEVAIEVYPGGGVAEGRAGDAGFFGDFGEAPAAEVAEQAIRAAGRLGAVEQVGEDEDIEPAVAVVVGEGSDDAAVYSGEATRFCLFLEGAVALVDVEEIGGGVAADVEIEMTVVVDVGEDGALAPDGVFARGDGALEPAQQRGFLGKARSIGDVFESPVA